MGFVWLRFADPLKQMLSVFGLTADELDGGKKYHELDILCGRSPRYAMQMLGTEWGRNLIGYDVWVNHMKRRIGRLVNEGHNHFVIDDIRFHNELSWFKYMESNKIAKTKVIRIVRENNVAQDNEYSQHRSETEMDSLKEDWLIENNGSIGDMYRKLKTKVGGFLR